MSLWGNRRGGWNDPFPGNYGAGGWGSSYDPFLSDPFFGDFGLFGDALTPSVFDISVPTQRYGRDRADRDIRNAERQLSGKRQEPNQANYFRTSTTTVGDDGVRRTKDVIKYRNDEGNELVKEVKRMGDQMHVVTKRIINGKEEIDDNLYADEAKRFDETFDQIKKTPRIEDLRDQMANLQNQISQLEQGGQPMQLGQGQQQEIRPQVSGYQTQQQGQQQQQQGSQQQRL